MKIKFKLSNRILSLVLAFVMVLGMMPMTNFTAVAATTPTAYDGVAVTPTKITSSNYQQFGLTDENWSNYNGYYAIRNASELYGFAALVNGGNRNINGVLLQDIVVNTSVSASGAAHSWTPIGATEETSFLGTFDGAGHSISGLYHNNADASYVGLFGCMGEYGKSSGATVKNLTLKNSYISGKNYVGGIVGSFFGYNVKVTHCKTDSDVSVVGNYIYASGEAHFYVGGIVGGFYGTTMYQTCYVSYCVNLATVIGNVVGLPANRSLEVEYLDTYIGSISGAWNVGTNAGIRVTVSECYSLENCVKVTDGDEVLYRNYVSGGSHEYIEGSGYVTWADFGGSTILSSATASHTCVAVATPEITANCAYGGHSAYSYCLICGSVTSGTKTVTDANDTHFYAGATCTVNGVCQLCGDANGPLAPDNHVSWHPANCIAPATCAACSETMGEKNPANHIDADQYTYTVNKNDESKHDVFYEQCNALAQTEGHSYDAEGKCTKCTYECAHPTFTDSVCDVCDYQCTHSDIENNKCTACGLEGSVKYINRVWNSTTKQVDETVEIAPVDIIEVTSNNTELTDGWYIVNGTVSTSLYNYFTVSGTVHLILADGASLTTDGCCVNEGNSLYIYAQSNSADMGCLNLTGRYSNNAVLGGAESSSAGKIVINGGSVQASVKGSRDGAAIGNGYKGKGGEIIINGGFVKASTGGYGAAIGSGTYGKTVSISINGGTVYASSQYGAAIGGDRYGDAGNVTINGGNIYATSYRGDKVGTGYEGETVTVTDVSGNDVTLSTITLSGAAADTPVTKVEGITYGLTDVKTYNTDKLYFYLPADAVPTSITAGGVVYDCKEELTYYPGHDYVDATCNLPKTCTRCGHTEGEALGHKYVNGVCTVCGLSQADGVFYISTADQLMMFADYVNAGNQSADAVLMADIDLTGYAWTTICETGLYYSAYGTDLGYSGTFDGNGHVIKNITVTSSTTRDASCGLFGTVSGTIKNLGIENFTFVDGGMDIRTGAIVGQLITANGKVSNCYVKNATINPGAHVTGGIAGCVYDGTIENCYVVESTITGTANRYGYIVGDSRGDGGASDRPGTVTNCYTDNATIRSNNVGNVTNCATKTTDDFAIGEVTYLLNGSKSDGELVWYQTLTVDAYPKFSGSVVYYDSTNGYNNHVHNWEYKQDDDNKITATCDVTGCTAKDGGYVTIAAPSDLTYTGNKIEAVVDNQLTTGATVEVTYTGNTTDGYPVNAGEYTAKITLDGKEISVEYTIEKATPTADDFVFTAPTDLIYDGNEKEATVTVKDGIVGMGEINVKYYRYWSGDTWLDNERAPSSPGRYKVGIWLKEGDNYEAVSSAERIWLGSEFEIKYLKTDAEAIISGTKGTNGWYTSAVTLKAPEGYAISKSIYDTYGDSLTFASEQNKTVTYYLKDVANGKIAEKTVELKIDLTDPTAEYAINDNGWRKFINFVTFGIFCKDNADLSIAASDTMDSSVTVQYVVSNEKLTASEITDWNDYSVKVALNPKAKNYIYIKVTDDAGRTVVYESGVVVFADSTASAEIEYTKHSTEDVTAQIVFNGNTVKEVKYGSTVLTADHYIVTDSGIQFKAEYLNTFAAGNYSFVVTYNPVGEIWVDSADGIANATVGTTTIELTVKKATLTITDATLADKTYDGTTSGTVSGVTFKETDKLVLGTDYTATVVYDGANAGSRTAIVTVTLLNTDKANAYALESTTHTMDATIGKANAPALTDVKANYKFTITGFEADVASVGMPADAGAITYTKGNASVSGDATVTAWSVDENGKVTATISGGAKQDVITLPVTVSSDNYEDAAVNVVVTLGNRPAQSALTVNANSSVIYGNELTLSTEGGSGTGDVTYSIVSGNENATIEGNVLTATKVGTVVITATKAGDDDYEPATSAQFTVEVTQRELEITGATATDRDYNGTADVTITNITLGNIHSNDDVSVTFNTTGIISSANKGEYSEVTVSGLSLKGADAANYKLPVSTDGKYTVSTEVEVSALDISGAEITLGNALTYNGSEQTQTVTGVTKNGLTVTYTVSGNKNTNHGSYELTVTGTDNFTGMQTKAWSIAKRKITVTATAQTITYGKDITADAFTSTNVVNGHKLDVTLTPSTANVTVSGTITVTVNDITADGTSVIGNYDVSVSSGKLTIQPDLSAISDLTTENVTSADKADIEAVKDMMSKADCDNADEETKAAWDAIVANCDTLLAKIEAVAIEIDRVTDKTGSYNAGTVNSDDAADLNKLAADIKALIDSKNLTNEERAELTSLAETVAALQKVITDTTAENNRIAEELAKFDKDTVNSDSSDELAQLLSDIEKQLDSTNLTEAEKKALEDAKTAVTDMQKIIADTAAENDRISNEVDKYSIDTVKSSDEEALNTLLDEIKDQLTSTHLTDEEISELNGDKTAVEDLLAKIKGTDELIDKLTGDVGSYEDETVKSTDRDALEQIIEDAQALIDSDNVTDSEKETLKGVQEDAQALIDVIDDTAEDVKAITDNAASYNDETAKSTDKDELEQVIKDIDALLDGDNLTDAERESLEEIKQTVQDLIDTIDDTADEIKAANDTIGGLDEDTVKSTDKETIEQVIENIDELLDGDNLTEDERKALEDTKAKAEDLLDAIDDAAKAPATENTEKVKDVTAENVTPDDKTDLEKARADLEKALEDHGDNYTDEEKKAIEDEIKRIEDALEVIGNVEVVEEQINNLPDNITKDDTDDVDAAKKAYDELSDYEKMLVDPETKKKLEEAIKAAEEANKPADTTSPGTGDNSNIPGLFALMLGSLAAMFAIIFGTKKKKAEDK